MSNPFAYSFAVLLALTTASHASQTLSLSENKRLTATISSTSMNRIAITNDRISQVFGDEGTFVTQSDDSTGQIFIKPSTENGTKPLSLTLITENGVTQDLTLEPKEKPASTIILKGLSKDGSMGGTPRSEVTLDKTLSIQENVLSLVKKALLGQLPIVELPSQPQRVFPEGVEGIYLQSYQAGPVVVHAFELSKGEIEDLPEEKAFSQAGDMALCISSGKLFVVSRT